MKTVIQLFSVPIVLITLSACNGLSKEEAYNKVVDNSIFLTDTLIRYSLTSDSLVLEFVKPLQHKDWVGEIFIRQKAGGYETHIKLPSDKPGELGRIHFINGKVVFKNLDLIEDSLDAYEVLFHAVPVFQGCKCQGEVYAPPYLFVQKKNRTNMLSPPSGVKDFNIVKFDFVQLKKLPEQLQQFCRDSIQSKYGITFTDAEIEEKQ